MSCSAPGLGLRLDMTLVSMLISRVNSRHDFEHDLRVSSRVEFRGELRGDFRGELRGETRGDSRGEFRGEFRGETSCLESHACVYSSTVVKPYTQCHSIAKLNHFQSPLQFTNATMDDRIEWFFHKRNV